MSTVAEKPMYKKYYEVWSAHAAKYGPQTALLFQVGGFFEIYDTENLTTGTTKANIREIAELCQLSLSQHAAGEGFQTLFGGFPDYALGKFEKILVSAGWTVVIVVQKKGATGAVEDRIVDHISSPGCYVDSGNGSGSLKERRLVGCVLESMSEGPVSLRRLYWSVAALDIATGHLWFAEGAGSGTPDRLHQFLCLHPPSELIVWSDGLPAAAGLTESLKKACDAFHLRCLPAASVALEEAVLSRFWPGRTLMATLQMHSQARRALAYLMEFAGDHMPSALLSLKKPDLWVPDGEVRLGNAALEQLGLFSLRDEKQSLLGLMDRCRSVAGRRLMRSRLMRPISDAAELERRLDRMEATTGRDPVPTERGLRSLYDISRLWRRLELGSATMNDMACLLRSFDSAAALGYVDEESLFLPWLFGLWSLDATTQIAREEGVVPIKALPFVATAEVETLFAEGAAIRKEAEALCESWSSSSTAATKKVEQLYLDDAEGGGFRITGTKRRINAVFAALRDGGDLSAKVTPYKTSAILESATLEILNTRHRAWMRRWIPAWTACWSSAIQAVVTRGASVAPAIEAWCADLDLSWTLAGLAREWLWKRPVFVAGESESWIDVTRLRHPILERIQIGGAPYVSHSLGLGSSPAASVAADAVHTSRGLLLYGMNASGKSSLMKALGLCTLLAQCGFPVPAATCRISPFRAIFTRILGNDNLWAGLSSFAVEMTEFREILRFADSSTLVLGDELCSGTESLSATALVAAGVEHLSSKGTKFVFATHLHELAALPDIAGLSSVKAVHLKVTYDAAADRLVYDRHLAPGSGSALYGLEVCRALDLPHGYLERATVLRKTLAGWSAPHTSTYSAGAVVDACAVCRSSGKNLEMHHVVPQAAADTAAAEGFDLNAAGNLACLCATCHDDHHAGRLEIQGWKETSTGRVLKWSRPSLSTKEEVGLTDEVKAWIREQRLLKPRLTKGFLDTMQRMAKQMFDVEITVADIKATR
jgi:DNA mismatch repair protein MutS